MTVLHGPFHFFHITFKKGKNQEKFVSILPNLRCLPGCISIYVMILTRNRVLSRLLPIRPHLRSHQILQSK